MACSTNCKILHTFLRYPWSTLFKFLSIYILFRGNGLLGNSESMNQFFIQTYNICGFSWVLKALPACVSVVCSSRSLFNHIYQQVMLFFESVLYLFFPRLKCYFFLSFHSPFLQVLPVCYVLKTFQHLMRACKGDSPNLKRCSETGLFIFSC